MRGMGGRKSRREIRPTATRGSDATFLEASTASTQNIAGGSRAAASHRGGETHNRIGVIDERGEIILSVAPGRIGAKPRALLKSLSAEHKQEMTRDTIAAPLNGGQNHLGESRRRQLDVAVT